ncbi:ankyrin [Nemania sp. FL0031]|nr:ankyrin [Nemania sp. FL0031]
MRTEKLDWDPHYDEVRQLYLTERRDLKEIITIFKEQYGFNATPRQWTSRLETWGLRKNLDAKQWRSVYSQVMKRKLQGKDSEVFLSGERLPPTKIQKGFKNHHLGLPSLHNRLRSPSPPCPNETILVATPPSQLGIQWPRNLPWFQFERKLKQYFDMLSRERRRALLSKVLDSPNFPTLHRLLRKCEKRGVVPVTTYGASEMRGFLMQYMPEAVLGEHVERAELITCRHQSSISPLAILQVFVFLVSNSLPGSSLFNRREEDQLEEDNRVMAAFEILSLFKCPWEELFIFKNPTVAALADKLFASTIRLCRADILQRLVKAGLDILPLVNRPISFYLEATSLGRFYYKVPPIYAALYMRSSWMVWILLDHGAELNHMVHKDENGYEYEYPSPIACAALSYLGRRKGKDSVHRMIRLVLGKQRHIDEIQLICSLVALATRPLREERTVGAKIILDRLMQVELSTGLQISGVVLALAIRFDYAPLIQRLVFSSRKIKYDAGFDTDSLPWGPKIVIFTPLVEATCRRNYMLCRTLLKRGAQPDPPAERGKLAPSALQYAAFLGEIDIVHLLLAHGADTAHQSYISEIFPIHYFSYSESRLLPRATALCLAIYQNHINIFQALLDAGAKPAECDMYSAIMSKNPMFFMSQMLERGARPDEQTFIHAKSRGDNQLVNLLVEYWPESHMQSYCLPTSLLSPSNSTRYSPGVLVEAAYKAAHGGTSTSLLKFLLDQRDLAPDNSAIPVRQCLESLAPVVSVFFGDSTTCSIFARYGLLQQKLDFGLFVRVFHEGLNIEHLNISIHYLPSLSTFPTEYDIEIQYSAVHLQPVSVRFEPRDFSLLGIAIKTGRKQTVDLLLGIGIKPTAEDFRISRKYHWAWKRLLESIGNLNIMENGNAVLVNAAMDSDLIAAVEWLIERDIDFNAPHLIVDGRHTVLQAVCSWGDLRLVRLLVGRGADINAPAVDWGATALQLAAIRGFMGIAKFLIGEGADCNAPAARERGRTALEGAAEHGRLDMLEFLLHSGVCTDGPFRRQYFRAIKFAEAETHYAAAQLLRDHREWSDEDHDGFRDTCLCEYRSHYRRCHHYTKIDGRDDEHDIGEERFEAHEIQREEGIPCETDEFADGQMPLAEATVRMLQSSHETTIPDSPGLRALTIDGTDETSSAAYKVPCAQANINMDDKEEYANGDGDGIRDRGCERIDSGIDSDCAGGNRLLSPSIFEVENSLGHEDWIEEFVDWDGQVFGLFGVCE